MNIRKTLARVIEANRISGIKAYGEYQGGGVWDPRIQNLMEKSIKAGRELDKLMAKAREGK